MSTRKKYSEETKMNILNDIKLGLKSSAICSKYDISSSTLSTLRLQFAAKGLLINGEPPLEYLELQNENKKLKELLGETILENNKLKELLKIRTL